MTLSRTFITTIILFSSMFTEIINFQGLVSGYITYWKGYAATVTTPPLQWRHNESDCVTNHRRLDCLLNRLFRHILKKNIKVSRHWPLCMEMNGNSTVTVNSPHKGPVTRTTLPYDYVIMTIFNRAWDCYHDYTGNISFQDIFSLMMLLMKLYVPCARKNLIKSMLVSNIKTEAVIPICDLIRENQSQIGLLNGMSWPPN